jgi:hypothetical protein
LEITLMYAYRFQLTRGEAGGWKTVSYKTETARDAAAQRWANEDGEGVLLFEYRQEPSDTFPKWWNTGVIKPTNTPTAQALAEYDEWQDARVELSRREATDPYGVSSSEWGDSDDRGVDIAHRLATVLRGTAGP